MSHFEKKCLSYATSYAIQLHNRFFELGLVDAIVQKSFIRFNQKRTDAQMHTSDNGKLKIRWFEKFGDRIGEESIVSLSTEQIYHLLNLGSKRHNIKGVVQHIPKEKAHLLQPYLGHKFDFDKHTYFLGYYS